MPAGTTALFVGLLTAPPRVRTDLSRFRTGRIAVNNLGTGVTLPLAGAKICLQASLDNVTWLFLDGAPDGALVAQAGTLAFDVAGYTESADVVIATALRTLVYLRAITVGGNGIIAPFVGPISAVFTG